MRNLITGLFVGAVVGSMIGAMASDEIYDVKDKVIKNGKKMFKKCGWM